MKRDTRLEKMCERLDSRLQRHDNYVMWIRRKPARYSTGWTKMFGKTRSCINIRLGGYIGRRRQIVKCFMKGWYCGE